MALVGTLVGCPIPPTAPSCTRIRTQSSSQIQCLRPRPSLGAVRPISQFPFLLTRNRGITAQCRFPLGRENSKRMPDHVSHPLLTALPEFQGFNIVPRDRVCSLRSNSRTADTPAHCEACSRLMVPKITLGIIRRLVTIRRM